MSRKEAQEPKTPRIGFIADIHIGNHSRWGGEIQSGLNARCQHSLRVLSRACERAYELGCCALVILGDLFETAKPTPQEVRAVRDVLARECLPVIILMGNHDMVSSAVGDHALGPLHGFSDITVVDKPRTIVVGEGAHRAELFCVPFQPGDAREWLRPTVVGLAGGSWNRVLALHLGLIDGETPPFLKSSRDAIESDVVYELSKTLNLSATFAGNWHQRRVFYNNVYQAGTLIPHSFSDAGLSGYGALWLYDLKTSGAFFVEIPGPRFVTVRAPDLKDFFVESDLSNAAPLYLKVHAAPEEIVSVQALLEDQSLRLPDGLLYEVIPDDTDTQVAARTAATNARSAETLDEALAGFVEAMEVSADVDKADVLDRAKRYLDG